MFDVQIIERGNKIKVLVNGKAARRARSLESSRILFKWKDSITGRPFLIKLDKLWHTYHNYDEQSTDEIKRYKKIKPEDKKYFPELVAFGKSNNIGFVMQPFYKLDYFDWEEDEAEMKKVEQVARKYKLTDCECYHNMGKLPNGQGLIFDFGV